MAHLPLNIDVIEFSPLETLWAEKLKVQKTYFKNIKDKAGSIYLLLGNSWISMFRIQSMQIRCILMMESLRETYHSVFPSRKHDVECLWGVLIIS